MGNSEIFNLTVCILGIAIFLIHSINLLLKKNKRNDEKNLLAFFTFTAFHFATYLAFTLIKPHYTSNSFIMGFYTGFYIMNNLELLFLFAYARSYIKAKKNTIKVLTIINIVLIAIFIALDIGNLFGHYFFYADAGKYQRAGTMILSQGYQFVAFAIVFVLAVFNKKLSKMEKAAFAIYCLVPFAAIIFQDLFPGYALGYLSIVISIEVLFLFTSAKRNALLLEEERKNKEAEIRIMMSQIKPHFIYNALSSISTLINIDPKKAEEALDNFTEYLRANLSALSDTHPIPFSTELKHIETYLALEKVRFGERLNLVYDIQEHDFLIPPLSIQPIVENAVKHGILQKIEGGTVRIKTYSDDVHYVVEIEDNGVGFDLEKIESEGHVGLKNVSYRIQSMCDGKIAIQSKIGEGTKVIIQFHKESKR